MEPLELEEDQNNSDSSLLGFRHQGTMRAPVRLRRYGNCTRVIVFFVIAIGVVILPLGMLRTMEGIENSQGGLTTSFDGHSHEDDISSSIFASVSVVAEVTVMSSLISISTAPTAVSSIVSSVPSSSPAVARPDLPERDLTPYVDTLIGTEGYGHSFAGATIPFGMAKPVPDSSTSWQNQAGFLHDESFITGVSQLHDEGTGGNPSLGNFPIWMSECRGTTWDTCPTSWGQRIGKRVGEPRAHVGQFGVELDTGFDFEMTSTRRTNLFRIKALDIVETPVLSVGLVDLSASTLSNWAEIRENFRVVGNGTFKPSFGEGQYTLHFCMDAKTNHSKIRSHLFIDDVGAGSNGTSLYTEDERSKNTAVMLQLTPLDAGEEVLVRMGMSFISPDQACSNAEEEIPDFDFEKVSKSSVSQFETLLNRIRVDTTNVTDETLILFYSSLYRTLISPQNYTGENPLWETKEPSFDSFYCIWDTFRFSHPLYNIFIPEAQSQMVRSLIDIFRFEGWLPECRMSFCKGITQSGSNADTLLTDSYIKGVTDVPWADALQAIRKDAEVEPENWGVEGRGNIREYDRLGYVPVDANYSHGRQDITHRTVSRSIEYAHNDFSIAMFARKSGDRAVYEKYISRASNWQNLWMKEAVEPTTGITGFFQGRYSNGSWATHSGEGCITCTVGKAGPDGEFYEESAWSYSWFVPHDYAKLIELVGGRDSFVNRLDVFFNWGFANPGNEPGLLQAVLYHYAGQPAKSVVRTRKLIGPVFNIGKNGLPGNDDAGSLGAYLVWIMSGLVPIAGQSVYLILPPAFSEVQWTVTGSRIIAHNFSPENEFIQSVTVDGQPWTKNWISHEFFSEGKTMEITLGNEVSAWGTGEDDVPPSLSTGGFEYE